MAGHPEVTELSDLAEGLLPASRSADVRRHLDSCELCADVYASLGEIRDLLGTLPGPARMPDDVAGRIDAALAAEALLNSTAPEETVSAVAENEARVSRETSVAADRPAGHARTSTTGPGRRNRRHGGRRRVAVLGTVFTVAALGLGSVLLTSLGDDSGGPDGDSEVTTQAGDTFAASTLKQHVSDLLAQKSSEGGRSPRSTTGMESAPDSRGPRIFNQPTDVPGCVQEGIGRDETALATEEGVYQGTRAMLVVLTDPADTSKVTAYIVDATCVTDPSVGKAEVLLTHTYPRAS
ncbi:MULTISPECIES: anti-sigma factor family protein [unclassified Streptomyces]|uniref:anti-sigma factor family protein n=1 Tax=Streptomyces sp. NBRC 14336 TaxID=3030992 RepID=UPI0025557365|nr:zf-HC2 domain-containing protein [Streptomyces sp. NBRC 14336]WBO82478.1 zf-HC2 domain-containing protein [Streptomyces sp. SBE_14.2]